MFSKETTQDTFFLKKNTINCKGKLLNLDELVVMGILNLTPDSFFDGGKYNDVQFIVNNVQKMLDEGAKIIDIGGYSSRPGAAEVNEEEELNRVIPIIELLISKFPEIIISIDTFRSKVAKQAINAGAAIINDISAGKMDKNMFAAVKELQVPYIIMHMQGTPKTMQENPTYKNVTLEVIDFFAKKINELNQLGVNDIIIDPGFGFGKTVEHNYELLNNLEQFKILEVPILIGVSRKSMINKVLNTTPKEALNGTTTLNTLALSKGANILRVHDVLEAKQVVELYKKMIS
ncbi:MAG: dihydropteroate synthase [Flavobacteriales bacterium]|nr:dihydropteroate synthase [Flavobacteriales bacterium]MCB9364961.1 dihydropteroate synthase [Flavobacteriales bacterium]